MLGQTQWLTNGRKDKFNSNDKGSNDIITIIIITITLIVIIIGIILKTTSLFLNLIDKHFPQDHKFHNIEVSYSCMPNIKSAINSHNWKILHPPVNSQSRICNYIKKTGCPLQKNAWVKIHYIKQILVQKTLKRKFITAYQKQNLKQDIWTIKMLQPWKAQKWHATIE